LWGAGGYKGPSPLQQAGRGRQQSLGSRTPTATRRTPRPAAPPRGRGSCRVIAFGSRILLRRPVLVLLVPARHHIDAAEPAVEVDVGAAPAAERAELGVRGFSADRAGTGAKLLGHAITPSQGPPSIRTRGNGSRPYDARPYDAPSPSNNRCADGNRGRHLTQMDFRGLARRLHLRASTQPSQASTRMAAVAVASEGGGNAHHACGFRSTIEE